MLMKSMEQGLPGHHGVEHLCLAPRLVQGHAHRQQRDGEDAHRIEYIPAQVSALSF